MRFEIDGTWYVSFMKVVENNSINCCRDCAFEHNEEKCNKAPKNCTNTPGLIYVKE